MESLLRLDTRIFLQLNGIHSGWWDTVMMFITRKETWMPLYLILLFLVIYNYKHRSWLILGILVIGLTASDQMANLIKEMVHRHRPGYEPAIANLTHIVLRKGGELGFPSNHAVNTFFVMTFTGYLFRNRYSLFSLVIWAFLVSYSRIYVGAHYPLDILAAWILGFLSGWIFFRFLIWLEPKFSAVKSIEQINPLPDNLAGLISLVLSTVIITLFVSVYLLHKYNFL